MKRRRQPISPIAAQVEVLENRALLSAVASASSTALTSAQTSLLKQLTPANEVVTNANTSPFSNGDLNPYGTAFVPQNFATGGLLKAGDLLVSNFNNGLPNNQQGTGTTIVDIHPDGSQTLFYQSTSIGLTTALGVLSRGYVIVGNLPTTYPPSGPPQIGQGSLQILDKNGNLVETLPGSALLDGPWDLAVNDQGARAEIFVSNVLNGTVTRIDLQVPSDGSPPAVLSETRIGSHYAHRTDPSALVVGPTGLAFDQKTDTLFVASTEDNAIYAIHDALYTNQNHGKGQLIYTDPAHLHGPLGLVLLPDGNLIASEGDAINPPDSNHFSELTEFTQTGKFIAQYQVDSAIGSAFGIAIEQVNDRILFAAVDDNTNTVSIWSVPN